MTASVAGSVPGSPTIDTSGSRSLPSLSGSPYSAVSAVGGLINAGLLAFDGTAKTGYAMSSIPTASTTGGMRTLYRNAPLDVGAAWALTWTSQASINGVLAQFVVSSDAAIAGRVPLVYYIAGPGQSVTIPVGGQIGEAVTVAAFGWGATPGANYVSMASDDFSSARSFSRLQTSGSIGMELAGWWHVLTTSGASITLTALGPAEQVIVHVQKFGSPEGSLAGAGDVSNSRQRFVRPTYA